MKTAVKTVKKAEDIITNLGGEHIKAIEGRCACGRTIALTGEVEGLEYLCKVNICSECGDDDAFVDDVLETL